jgi:hypothetical protein
MIFRQVRFEDRDEGLLVVNPGRQQIVLMLSFLGIFVTGWKCTGWTLERPPTSPRAVLPWLLLLGPWGALVVGILLWTLFGREVVTTDGRTLSIRYELLGLARERRYDLGEVRALRYVPPADHARLRLPESVIAFEHRGKTIRFGVGLDEAQAQRIVTRKYRPR